MEKKPKKKITVDRDIGKKKIQFVEIEQEFCLGLFRIASWDLYLP